MTEVSTGLDQVLRPSTAEEARVQGEALLKAASLSGDHRLRVLGLCKVAESLEDPRQAAEKVASAKAIAEEQYLEEGLVVVKLQLGRICARPGGDADQALDLALDAQRGFQRLESRAGEAVCSLLLGEVHAMQREKDQALRCFREALTMYREMGDGSSTGRVLQRIAQEQLGSAKAVAPARKAVAAFQATGEAGLEADAWLMVAQALGSPSLGGLEAAKESVAEARAIFARLEDRSGEVRAMELLTQIYLRHDLPAEAVDVGKSIVSYLHQAQDREGEAKALLSLVNLLLPLDHSRAQRVLAAAVELMQSRGLDLAECRALQAQCDHARQTDRVRSAVQRHGHMMHVPRTMIIEPGYGKGLQQAFAEFAKAA